jgi:hypothetical protein
LFKEIDRLRADTKADGELKTDYLFYGLVMGFGVGVIYMALMTASVV